MSKHILLAVDMQTGFDNNNYTQTAIDNLVDLLDNSGDFFKNRKIFSTFVNKHDTMFYKILDYRNCTMRDYCKVVEKLQPYVDKHFEKSTYSAVTPELLKYLKDNEIDTVYIAGFDTDACVMATAYALFDNGIRPIVIQNCCASTAADFTLHKDALDIIRRAFGRPQNPCVVTSGDVKEIAAKSK